MSLGRLLEERKSSIIRRWVHAVFESYPADTSDFFQKQQDRFLNPIGHTISEGISSIFHHLLQDFEAEKFFPALDDIIKIRAVQDLTPSQALSFLFLLKKVIKEEAGDEIQKRRLAEELAAFEARIDQLILLSFDIYMKCRERIYEIKSEDVRRMTFRLLQKANLICGVSDEASSPDEGTVLTQKIKG